MWTNLDAYVHCLMGVTLFFSLLCFCIAQSHCGDYAFPWKFQWSRPLGFEQ